MKYFSSFRKSLVAVSLLSSSLLVGAAEWRTVYFLDFGGNDGSESSTAYRSYGLTADEGETEIDFIEKASPRDSKYSIFTYPENNQHNWCVDGAGDHTNPTDHTKGYYLALDCPQPDAIGQASLIYGKTLTGICTGVTFRFSAWVSLLSNDDGGTGTYILLSISDGQGNSVVQSLPEEVYPSDCSGESLNWTKVEFTTSVDDSYDLSSLKFEIYPSDATGNKYATTGGYDIGIDDIQIEIEQPSLSFSHTDLLYGESAKITASLGSDVQFFGDMNSVQYMWQYSADSLNWITLMNSSYINNSDFAYTISSFDKDDNTGNGNGWYRLVLGSVSLNGWTEQDACSVVGVTKIDETKNKAKVTLCDGNTTTIGGTTISADDASPKTFGSYEVEITKIPKTLSTLEPEVICVGKSYNGTTYNEEGIFQLDETIIKSLRVDVDGNYCDSIVISQNLEVTTGKNQPKDVIHCGVSNPFVLDGTTYTFTQAGAQTPITINDPDNCVNYIYNVTVGETYDQTIEVPLCEGNSYNGVVYTQSTTLPTQSLKTVKYGCDSIVTVKIVVTDHVEATLDPVTICQSDFGEGKTAFSFGGKDYMNTGSTDLVLNLEKTDVSKVTGCDSISKIKVTIKPMLHVYRDTLICRDQILFGKEWTVAGNYEYTFTYEGASADGCDSVLTWRIQVLDIQLKLRAQFGINEICDGQSATLIVDLTPADVPLTWEPELSSRNPLRPTVMPESTTVYVAHAQNSVGCHATDSIEIKVSPNPVLTIDTVYQQDRKLEFTVDGGTGEFTYMIGTRTVEPAADNTIDGLTYGTNTLTVTDKNNGCVAIDTFKLEPMPLEPQTIISPNGDGVNDYWVIKNIDVYPNAYVRIYDRFGKLIYEQRGGYDSAPFDGTANGTKLPSTDYWYEIDIDDIDKQYVGHFTLLR